MISRHMNLGIYILHKVISLILFFRSLKLRRNKNKKKNKHIEKSIMKNDRTKVYFLLLLK